MNFKRLIIAIPVIFITRFVFDFLIHGVWLQAAYKESMNLWRSEADMQSHFGWLLIGQFLACVAFVALWAKGFASTARIQCALAYGLFMGLFLEAHTLITFATQPLPVRLTIIWFVAGIVQTMLLGLLLFFVYKPLPASIAAKT